MSNPSKPLQSPKHGILIFAHGSSDPEWTAPVRAVQAQLAQKFPNRVVTTAYLERASPDFFQAARQMVQDGATTIVLLPFFLGVGKHLKEDLPVMISSFLNEHPGVHIRQLPAVGQANGFASWVATLIDDTTA